MKGLSSKTDKENVIKISILAATEGQEYIRRSVFVPNFSKSNIKVFFKVYHKLFEELIVTSPIKLEYKKVSPLAKY